MSNSDDKRLSKNFTITPNFWKETMYQNKDGSVNEQLERKKLDDLKNIFYAQSGNVDVLQLEMARCQAQKEQSERADQAQREQSERADQASERQAERDYEFKKMELKAENNKEMHAVDAGYKGTIAELQAKLKKAETKLAQRTSETLKKDSRLAEIKAALDETHEKLEQKRKETLEKGSQLAEIDASIAQFQDELRQGLKFDTKADPTAYHADMSNEHRVGNEERKRNIDEAIFWLRGVLSDNRFLRDSESTLVSDITQKDAQLEVLLEKSRKMDEHLEALRREIGARKEETEEFRSGICAHLERLVSEKQQLSESNDVLTKDIAAMRIHIRESQKKCGALSESVRDLEHENKKISTSNASLISDTAQKDAEIEKLDSARQQDIKRLQELEQQNKMMSASNASLILEISQKDAEIGKLDSARHQATELLKSSSKNWSTTTNSHLSELQDRDSRIDALSKENEELKSQLKQEADKKHLLEDEAAGRKKWNMAERVAVGAVGAAMIGAKAYGV